MEDPVAYGNEQKPERTKLDRYRDLVEWISVYAKHASKSPDGLRGFSARQSGDDCGQVQPRAMRRRPSRTVKKGNPMNLLFEVTNEENRRMWCAGVALTCAAALAVIAVGAVIYAACVRWPAMIPSFAFAGWTLMPFAAVIALHPRAK